MSVPATRHDRGRLWHDPRRVANASLLMVPAMLVWMLLLWPLGLVLLSALGLDDTQMLYEAGAWGVAAFVLMSVLSGVPPTVGVVFAVRARRLGERRRGAIGVAANAVVAVVFVLGPVLGALFG